MKVVSQPESRANHGDGGFAWAEDGETLFLSSNANREFAAVVAYDIGSARFDSLVESEYDLADVRLCGADDAYLLWTENRDGFDVLGGRDLATGEPIVFPEIPEGVYSLAYRLYLTNENKLQCEQFPLRQKQTSSLKPQLV